MEAQQAHRRRTAGDDVEADRALRRSRTVALAGIGCGLFILVAVLTSALLL